MSTESTSVKVDFNWNLDDIPVKVTVGDKLSVALDGEPTEELKRQLEGVMESVLREVVTKLEDWQMEDVDERIRRIVHEELARLFIGAQ